METKVVHSQTKSAWNIIGVKAGTKYKIARIPYVVTGNEVLDARERKEALNHANFISNCFKDYKPQ